MKKQKSIYFHRIKHNILGGFSMGLLVKVKKKLNMKRMTANLKITMVFLGKKP